MNKIFENLKENWLNYSVLLLLIVMFFSSTVGSFSDSMSSSGFESTKSMDSNGIHYDSGFSPNEQNRKITKNGNLMLESDNYDLAKNNILSVSDKYNVIFLRNNEYSDNYDYKNIRLSGKIDALMLEDYLNEIKQFGVIESLEIYSNDVTVSYSSYSERIIRYSNQLLRYESMLLDKITIDEEIKVQQRIDQLEDDLFYLKKDFENLDGRVVYSDVSISLVEEKSIFDEVKFIDFENGFKAFIGSISAALWILVYLFGFLIPFSIIYGFYKLLKRLFNN